MTKRLVASRSESRTIFPLPFLLNFFTVSGLNAFLRSLVNKRPNSTIGKAVGLVFFILVSFQLLSQSSSQDGTTNKAYAIPTNSNLEISGDITLEAWLRPNAPQTNIGNVLMKGSYGYAFGIMNDGTIAFWQSGSQNSGPESTASIVQDGVTWTHVAIVNQGGVGTTFYINGVAVGSNATGGSFQTQAGDLYIGRQGAGCNCNFFNGLIDELRVWNDVRTAGEISANYDQVVSETEQGLAAYYRFNEGSGTTIYDEVTETAYTPSVNAISWNAENALSGASYFVDETASGSDDGTSWVDAFPYLQSALDIAISGDKIFVADGDYKPSTQVALNGTGNEQTFLIPSGVQLYGGFAGGEDITLQSSFDNRDFLVNETILNGDINGDDTAPVVNTSVQPLTLDYGTNRSDNALHVVAVQDATTQVIIDGFTIQNGHNDGTPTQYGGGLYVDASAGVSSEVRVENCVFRWNRADRGAAIGAYEPDAGAIINLTVLNSEVYQNSGYNYGAVHFQTSGTAVSNNYFVNTIFRENRTDYDGAAIMMITPGGDLDIINSLFYENDANRFYGGISAANVKDLRVINSTFANNYSHTNTSGGLHLGTHTSNLVRNSIFWGNTINIATDYQITVSSGSLNIGYSLVEGGATNINGTNTFNSGSNLTSDPLFADAANGDFTLQVSSPASEMGDAASLPTDIYDLDGDADTGEVLSLDLAGGVRVQGTVDMGAFETLGTTPNYALDFDGVNDYVNTDLAFSGQVFTAEFWVNPGSTQVNYASILDNNHNGSQGWTFIQNNSNLNEYWFFTPSSVNAYVTLPADTWSHVALVHNNVSLEKKIYLNGVLVANVAVTGDINYVTPDLYIGDWVSNTGTRPFNGQIDEVRIWNTARSTSEIVEYKDVKLSGTEPNLVAYYDFSDGPSSSTLTDQSLNSNNGTLNNMDPANDWIDAGFSLGDPYPFTIYNLVVTPDNNDALVDITTSTNVDLYYVITTTNDVPSPAQIQAGLNQAGAQAFNYSNYGGVTGAANFGVGDTNHTSGNDLISGNTYFIHWVGENAGQYSNILSAEFTTTTPPPPSDITITTISVSGGNLPQGSTDNLVYSFQMDVATSNAAAQGFQFNLAGTSVDADFEVNGVTLEVSTVSDFSSGVTSLPGTYDPTTNFGGADIQALDATEYVAGTTYYFRLSLDIAPGATAGNTFNVIAPVEGNFFFSNGIGTFNDGAITAGNTFTIGTPNYTLNFDGVSHAVTTIGNAPISGASPRTLEFLYKPLSNSGLQFPISYGTKAGGTYFGVQNNSGQLVFNGYAADLATGFTFTTGTWYHIAITFDGTTVKTFVDGNPTPTPSANLTLNTTATAIVFGGTTDGERITGQLDEVRLWDYAKSQAQVAAFMAQELDTASPPPGLLSYYDFSDGPNSSILTDQVSGNNANLNGMDAANDWVIADHGISGSGTTDSTNPSVLITSSESGTTTLATIPITITFSEKVVNFDLADITVGNGLASNFATSDTIVFTVDVAPSVGGIVTVDILSSVTTDLTGNGNDASAQFSIDYIAPENALDFDGVDDNILGSGINLANSDFTIEVWFNTSSPTSSQTIISVGDSETANETLHIRLENSDVRIGLAFDDVVVPWTVTTGWHHLAVIHNTSTLFSELYIDGVSIGSGTHSNPFIGNTNFKMGSNGWSVSALFEGEMDDIRIWNVARTPTQILGNLTTQLSSASGLVASYGFNHPSGSLLADLSGNGNDGTLTNFDFLGTSSDWVASTVPSCAPSGKFIGSANSDWSNPANWCGGVVPAANNVVENIVVSINSDITETQDLVLNANDFQVASGASLVLNLNSNSVQLTNNATFTNNGTVNVSNGTGVNATAGSFINNGVFFFDAGTQLASPEGTFINYGILKGFFTVNNNFTNPSAGTVAPGASPGCANFVSDFTNSGTLEVEIDGTIPCSQYDQISVGGTANLGGTLNVTLGFTPVSGNEFVIIDATAISGTFTTVNLPDANWSIAYDFPATGQVSLSYVDPTEMIGSTGPGGVGATDGTSPLQLWVKADAGTGTTTDDVTVSSWTDQSGFGRNMTGVNSPSFKNNIINGMPVLQFAAAQSDYFQSIGFTDNFDAAGFTIFTVAQMTGTGDQGFIGFKSQTGSFNGNVTFFLDDVNGTATDLRVSSPSTGTLGSTQWASDNRSPRLLSFTRSTSLLNAYDGGTNVVSNLAEGAIFNGTDPWMIGRYNNDNLKHFTGDVAEFVLFEGVLNTASRTIVENHLSAKYDIAHSVDLYAGDTAPNGDFDFDVIGIGMEADGSDPGGAAGGIILTNAGFLQDDGDYLFAGHDGSAHGFVQTDLPGSYTNRWARSWYVDVTDSTTLGTGGLVTVTFDFDEAGLGLPNANLALITRPGTTGNYAVASTDFLIAGNKVSFTLDASAIIDGHTYTIADDFVPNNALLFDGVAGNFVQGPDLTGQITNDFTFETWFRTTASDHRMMIALGDHLGGAGAQAQLKVNSNSVMFGVNALSSVVSPSATYTDGSWHHAAGVYSGTLLTLYLDGELIDTTSAPLSMDLSAFKIGDHSGGNLVWDGELDNMRIWNVARTQSEIVANAYNTLSSDSTLVVSYDFNSSTGTTLFDQSANSLNGTLVGTPPAWVSSTAWDIDIFAPTFEAGYPTITNINQNDFDLTVQLNEEGAVYYVVLPDSATVPSIDDIKAGTDGLGGAAVVASNFPVNLIGSEVIANITGLTDGTSYDVYVVAEDNEGAPNTQKVAVTFDITTLAFPENALSFDGTDDYVDIVHNASQNLSTFTLEAWVKTEQAAGAHIRIIMKPVAGNQNYSLAINNGYAHVRFDGSGGVQAEGTTLINDGKWHHLAGVFDNANDLISIYVDGVLEQQNATAQNPVTGSSPLYLGWSGVGQHYEGEMDQVRIWNTVRTQAELINHMNQSLNAEAGLVASYDFNTGIPGGDNTGLNTLADISGNGHDGTLNAFDLVGDTSNWVASGAFAPIIYQVSAANLNNLSVNWQPTNRGQVYVDINDASNFAGVPHATGHQIGNGSNSTSIVTGLSLAPNTRYFARIYYQDGGFTSPYSDTVEFMINAGSALDFDGTDDFISIPDHPDLNFGTGDFTVEFWINTTTTNKAIVSKRVSDPDWWRVALSGGNVYFELGVGNTPLTSTSVVNNGLWHHVAARRAGGTGYIYIDGVLEATGAFSESASNSHPVEIGSWQNGAQALYLGQLDEVRIWNVDRSLAEIQSSINNTLAGNENGLVAYYRFDEGDTAAVNTGISSPEVMDLSGNGNAGTMSGFAKTGATSNWVASGAFTLDNNTAPLAPTDVIAFSNSSNNIILQWKDNAYNETGYLIENADDYDFTLNVDTVVADLGVNATSFVHSAGADQGYFYRVTPVNGFETGASTSEVEFATTKSFPGYALNFDGIADSVDMGSTGDLQISGALTYEVWIKTTQTQGFILGKRNSSDLADLASNIELDGTGKIQGLVYDGIAGFPDVIQSNVAVNDGEWHHVAFVFEPSVALRLYIDGVLDKTFGISSTNINGASYPFRVGKYPTSSSAFFDGEMDEIRVWNDVRSDAEIFDNLYHDLKGDESNLVAYYPMDENSGTKLVDRSVNTNDGDIGGAGFIVSDVPLGPPMYLLSSTPLVNETNIARSANIQMTFDANVDAATLNDNIVVMGSHSGIITGVFFGGGTSVITFDPDNDFLAGEYVSAIISEKVRGLNGEVAVSYNLQFAIATGPFQGAFVEQTTGLEGVVDGAAAWADYDGDGDLDVAVSGWDFDYTFVIAKIFNNSGGTFTDIGASLTGVYEGSLDWGDYDGDGDLDLFATGFNDGGSRTASLYQNNAGTFSDVGGSFQGVSYSEADWGDFDNDGDLDLAVQGDYTASLSSTSIYVNEGGTFTTLNAGLVGANTGDLSWGDYDNDGDLDLVSMGYTSSSASIITTIYRNDNGVFTDIAAGLEGKFYGSVNWGDYDNDNDLDLLVSGSNTDNAPIIYRNDAGTFVDISAGLLENAEGESAWGDFDGDGDLDVVINGSGETNDPTTTIYINNAGSFVNSAIRVDNYLYSTVDWGDYDNDGDLDLLMTGTDDLNGGRISLYSNDLAPPKVLNATSVSTAGFTPNLIAPSGAVDLIVDVSTDPQFGSFISQDVSVGISGGVDINTTLTAGTQYFYRAKTDFGGGEESSYYISNSFMIQPGNALPFTGDDYVEVFDNPVLEPTDDFTIEFWFNTNVTGNRVFVEKGTGNTEYSVQQYSGDVLGLNVNGAMQTNGSYNDSTWHHAAFIYRGPGDGTIYVDGVEDVNAGSVAALGAPTYSLGRLTIGDRRFGGSFNIEGIIDEVRIWDDERTLTEIDDHRYKTLIGDEQGLIAYYQFDELSGLGLKNLSDNLSLDGSLENMVGNEWTASGALGAFGTVVSITADEANPAGSAIASELDWNIQFTSPVTGLTPGNFTLNSSGIGGGSSVSSVTDVDGFNWTITATVDAGDGTIGVDFTNDAGLNATITNAPFVGEVYTVDRTVPAATLTSSEPDPTNSGSFTVDIIFSEGVTGLGLGSIIVGNGTASNLVDLDGISYTVDITPGTDGLVSVDLGAGAAQDIAGNDNSAASTFSINYDTTGPTPAISSLESDPTNSSPFIVNIDFTEPVTGFDLTDVTVTNGSKANLTEAQNYAYDSQFGSAGSADGQFNDPYAVAEDGSGDIWVADRLNNRLQEFDPAGNFMQSVSFSAPIGLAVDGSDNLYVTRTNNLVYKIDQSGSALLTIGTSGSGAGQFANPSDVAIDHSTGDIYVTDYNNAKFLKYNAAGDFQWEAGGNGSGDGLFNYPTGIVVFGSTVYVTDDNNNRVQAFDTSGNFLFILGGPGTGDGQLQGVDKIDVDGNGNVYVLDRNNHRFQVFSSGGNYLGKFGSGVGSSDGEFNFPRGIAVSASGDVLISDGGNNRIQRIKGGPSGNFNFELTPAADGLITVNVGGSVATDLAGNLNNSAVQFSITADSQGPDVTINQSGSQLDPTNGTIVYDVIFSEPVSGFTDDTNVDFASSTVGGALSGTVTEEAPLDGTTYTLTVSGMSGTGDVIVNIQGGAASDLAGNVNSVSTSTDNTVTYDDVPPNLTITTPIATDNYINNAEASSVIISGASDAEDGQTVTLTIFDGSSTLNPSAVLSGGSWSVAVDFSSLADGNVTITADVTDLVGNAATSVNTNVTLDQTAPVVSLSTTEPDPTNSGVIPISITFSEGMSGFDVTDLTVGNGAASNFVDIDGTNYSADIYPSSDGLVTVDISAGVAFDAASNGNEAAPTLSITYDATVPTLDFVGIYSSNSNSIWAMVGDDVFVDFTSSEGIENVIVYIAGNVATIDDLADANDQTWSASYTMQVGDTEGSIAFSIDFDDLAGNTGVQVTTTTDASDVSFDKTDPNITGNSAHNIIENTTAIGTYSSGEIVIWSLSGDDASSLTIDGAGSLSFVSNPDFESPGDFNGDNIFDVVVEATDEAGNVATLAVSITVTDEDEINPVISGNITPSVQENTTSVGTYTADESVTWSLSGTDASEFSISSGVLSFLSPPDFESPTDGGANNVYDLVVTGTDAAGNIGTLAVSVTVTDVDEINPVISGNTTPSVQENTTSVGTYTADESVTWSLSGTDASAFSISSGVLSFLSPPDFESPTDGGANNVYDLIVTGTDGAGNIGNLPSL
ncbi:MAG: LamG-like jellyroll fold domain-containing protein [Marinoscillum sp.]|uniref:LamG-like jellyroll fold domain-containing protein n=1 Tax=Marinoscillum sp. TaxID=2024838 RepID=UPI0032FC4CA1